jgi:HEPN domain-containing protein
LSTLILGEQILSQNDFKKLARLRLREAKVLLENGCHDGAFYLVGYVVEYALKACIAGEMKEGHFPPKRDFINKCYTHDLVQLFRTAGLWTSFDSARTANAQLDLNWQSIKGWTEDKRYDPQKTTRAVALDAYAGVADPANGVLKWIKARWSIKRKPTAPAS